MSTAAPSVGTLPFAASVLDEARRQFNRGQVRQALELLQPFHHGEQSVEVTPLDRIPLLALLLECHLAHGSVAAATAIGEELLVDVVDPGAPQALHARAELASALDDAESAAELFLAAGTAGGDAVRPLLPWRSGAALALVRSGRRREGVALAHTHLARVQAGGTGHDVALALRTLATVESDGRRMIRLLEARDLLVFGESERLKAQIEADRAGLLLLDGATVEAIEVLRTVETFSGRLDLWPLQSRVRRLLERLGEAPRRMEAEALAVLTAAERRVALLALDGLSNREIATQLSVSVKAVEGHLSKVYRKLGIASRSALTAIVSRRA